MRRPEALYGAALDEVYVRIVETLADGIQYLSEQRAMADEAQSKNPYSRYQRAAHPAPGDLTYWRAVLADADRTIAEELPNLSEGEARDALQQRYEDSRNRSEEARIRDAYVAAWEKLLDEIGDLEFLIACLNGIADDFLGKPAPAKPSASGSGSTEPMAIAPGGTTTSS